MKKLTAQQFAAKYPDSETKTDTILENMACSECGQREMFHIQFAGIAEVDENGSDDAGDHEWEGSSVCRCSKCEAQGIVSDFTIPGLDELLESEAPDLDNPALDIAERGFTPEQ